MLTYKQLAEKIQLLTPEQQETEVMMNDAGHIYWIYDVKTEEQTRQEFLKENPNMTWDPALKPEYDANGVWLHGYD